MTVETSDVIEGVVVRMPERDRRPFERLDVIASRPTGGTPGDLVEGIRRDLAYADNAHLSIAEAMSQLRDDHGYSLRQIAEEVGCGKSTVDRHLTWLRLREENSGLNYAQTARALKAAKPKDPKPEAEEPKPAEIALAEPEQAGQGEPDVGEPGGGYSDEDRAVIRKRAADRDTWRSLGEFVADVAASTDAEQLDRDERQQIIDQLSAALGAKTSALSRRRR